MNEKPIEWFTTLGESVPHGIVRWLCLVFALLSAVFAFLMLQVMLLIPAGIFIVLFVVLHFFRYVEYAFIVVGDDMRISTVYNKNRRRKKMEFSLSHVERMRQGVVPDGKAVYLCKRRSKNTLYTLTLHQDGERTALVLEPDPAFLDLMKRRRLL